MIPAELVPVLGLALGVAGFGVTIVTIFYRIGSLEGKITTRINEHERRLNEIDRRRGVEVV